MNVIPNTETFLKRLSLFQSSGFINNYVALGRKKPENFISDYSYIPKLWKEVFYARTGIYHL